MIRQPKYQFGQKFTKETTVQVEGIRQKVSVSHVVIGIEAFSGSMGFEYKYQLAEQFPAAYIDPNYTTDWICERMITDIYSKVTV